MRLSVTHLRVGILLLNVCLTVLLAGQAALAIFYPPQSAPAPAPFPAGSLKSGAEAGGSRQNELSKAGQLAVRLLPPPPPVLPPKPSDPKDPDKPPEGDVEYPPGPLNEEWELAHVIIYEDPKRNTATLVKKDPAAAAAAAAGKKAVVRPRTTVRSPAPGRAARPQVPGAASAPTDKKMLRNRRSWKDEDLKIDIMVEDITRREFIYSDANQPGRLFALVRKESDYIDPTKGDGVNAIKVKKEEEDPLNPDSKKQYNILRGPPDWDKQYEDWKNRKPGTGPSAPGPGSTPPKQPSPNAAHAANSDKARPKSTVEQLEELKKVTTEMEKSKEFKKVPKAEQDRLRALLKPGAKK